MLLYIEGTKIKKKTKCTPNFKMQWEPWLKFSVASVKNNHNNEKKPYFDCVLGCMVRNITGRTTTPDTQQCHY